MLGVGVVSKLVGNYRDRRQTALALHSEFSLELSRTYVQTGVSLNASLDDFDTKAPAQEILFVTSHEEIAMCKFEPYFSYFLLLQ